MSSSTASLREALAQSQPADIGLLHCAQRYSNQRHFVVCCDNKRRWMLMIDELVLPVNDLEAIERILSSNNLRTPLLEGWLARPPKDMAQRLEAIHQARTEQRTAGDLPSFIFLPEKGAD